jgi:hypothetical protein
MAHNIVHTAGPYVVNALVLSACGPCAEGWRNGTLKPYAESGVKCTHGQGQWQVGQVGKRGGWSGIGPIFRSKRAAVLVCDALAEALSMPAQGIPQNLRRASSGV